MGPIARPLAGAALGMAAAGSAMVAAVDRGSPPSAPPRAYGVTTGRTPDGLFHLPGTTGRATVDFVVDTGASVSVLSADDARRLGALPISARGAGTMLQTAGGGARMTWWRLPDLTVAGRRIGAVEVAVVDRATGPALLGQDVLARLGTIVIAGDRLTVRAQ